MPISPIYTLSDVVLSQSQQVATRISTELRITADMEGTYCYAIIPKTELTNENKSGQLAKYRLSSDSTWERVGSASFAGGPDRWDSDNRQGIYAGVQIDADDIGHDVRFEWTCPVPVTLSLRLGREVERE